MTTPDVPDTSESCFCPANAPNWPDEREHVQQDDCLCMGCGNPLNEGSHGGNICA